ncbi:MAG: type II toxin -antitoxin system TacA 1-like antitoxin [Acidimicrobiales bacterium]
MDRKDRALNLRVSERQRAAYARAAALEGTTVSALVTAAADDRAEQILEARLSMVVASDVFDSLLASLDVTTPLAPSLEKALTEPRYQNR